jgi:hypothetical protein
LKLFLECKEQLADFGVGLGAIKVLGSASAQELDSTAALSLLALLLFPILAFFLWNSQIRKAKCWLRLTAISSRLIQGI